VKPNPATWRVGYSRGTSAPLGCAPLAGSRFWGRRHYEHLGYCSENRLDVNSYE
jgi:hypothetical protein